MAVLKEPCFLPTEGRFTVGLDVCVVIKSYNCSLRSYIWWKLGWSQLEVDSLIQHFFCALFFFTYSIGITNIFAISIDL